MVDFEAKVEDLETQMAEDTSCRVTDDIALEIFPYISTYAEVLWAIFRRDPSVDVSVLLEDFKVFVAECPPEPDVILPVVDLANFRVDLTFLGPTSMLR